MAARKGLSRLTIAYSRMEQMRSLERRVAAGAVDEVACREAIATAAREGHLYAARTAMAVGDREEWTIAETTRGAVEGSIERLAALRVAREETLAEAVAEHRASRLQLEQMERLLERRRTADAVEDGRRQQMGADDRYAARMAWGRMVQARDRE